MNTFYTRNQQVLKNLLFLFLVIIGTILFFRLLFPILAPFLVGYLLSLLFYPLVQYAYKKWNLPKALGSIIIIGLFLLMIYYLGKGLWLIIVSQTKAYIHDFPTYQKIFMDTITQWVEKLPSPLGDFVKEDGQAKIIAPLLERSGSTSLSAITTLPGFAMGTLISLITAYFFTKDKAVIADFMKKNTPSMGAHTKTVIENLKRAVMAYIKTQLILMALTGGLSLVGLWILGSPYAFLLAIAIGIIDALPFFGSGFILWPMSAYALLTGNYPLALGYLILYLLVNISKHLLQPKILGTQIGLHPLLALFAMYFGLKTIGVFGLIIGPIVAVLLKSAYDSQTKENTSPDGLVTRQK